MVDVAAASDASAEPRCERATDRSAGDVRYELFVAAAVGTQGAVQRRQVVVGLPAAGGDVRRSRHGQVSDAVCRVLVEGRGVLAVPDLLDARQLTQDLARADTVRQVEPGEPSAPWWRTYGSVIGRTTGSTAIPAFSRTSER